MNEHDKTDKKDDTVQVSYALNLKWKECWNYCNKILPNSKLIIEILNYVLVQPYFLVIVTNIKSFILNN